MPALPAVPKVIRLDFFSTWGANSRIRDRIFVQYSGTLSTTDLTTFLGTVGTQWGTNLSPRQDNSYTLNTVEGTDLSSSSSPQVVLTVTKVGTIVGNDLAAATAFVIKFKIARRYRGGHPRFYLAGLNQASLASTETWTGATQSAVISAFQAFITGIATAPPAAMGTITHVNVSYFAGFTNKTFPSGRAKAIPTVRVTPVVDTVTGYAANPIVGSQRRRNQQSA